MNQVLLYFMVAAAFILGPNLSAAPNCSVIFDPAQGMLVSHLDWEARLNLAAKLQKIYSEPKSLNEHEQAILANELKTLLSSHLPIGVYRYNPKLAGIEKRDARGMLASYKKTGNLFDPQNRYIDTRWFLHRVLRPSDQAIEALGMTKRFSDLDAKLTAFNGVTVRPLWNGKARQYTFALWDQSITLSLNEAISPVLLKSIQEAISKGRMYVSKTALPYLVGESSKTNDLEALADRLDWKMSTHSRVGVQSFSDSHGNWVIYSKLVNMGDTRETFTPSDREGFVETIQEANTLASTKAMGQSKVFWTEGSAGQMEYLGKPTPQEWNMIRSMTLFDQVPEVLEKMEWIPVPKLGPGVSGFANPVYGNTIIIRWAAGEQLQRASLPDEVKASIISAITENKNYEDLRLPAK